MDRETQIAIRAVTENDFQSWSCLWRKYLDFYDAELPKHVHQSTWQRLLGSKYFDVRGIIAEHDGKAVGLAHFMFQRHGWQIDDVTYLQDLFVEPACRGMGVGRQLIEAVYAAADLNQSSEVYWTTEYHNIHGRQLYDQIGQLTKFVKYERGV